MGTIGGTRRWQLCDTRLAILITYFEMVIWSDTRLCIIHKWSEKSWNRTFIQTWETFPTQYILMGHWDTKSAMLLQFQWASFFFICELAKLRKHFLLDWGERGFKDNFLLLVLMEVGSNTVPCLSSSKRNMRDFNGNKGHRLSPRVPRPLSKEGSRRPTVFGVSAFQTMRTIMVYQQEHGIRSHRAQILNRAV